jgi:hypothetical protein
MQTVRPTIRSGLRAPIAALALLSRFDPSIRDPEKSEAAGKAANFPSIEGKNSARDAGSIEEPTG